MIIRPRIGMALWLVAVALGGGCTPSYQVRNAIHHERIGRSDEKTFVVPCENLSASHGHFPTVWRDWPYAPELWYELAGCDRGDARACASERLSEPLGSGSPVVEPARDE